MNEFATTQPIVCTLFDNVFAMTVREVPWEPAVVDDGITRIRKSECPLIKLARFGDQPTSEGSLRHDLNITGITGAEGDYDAGEVSMDDAADAMDAAGIECALYTSASHTPEKPRWRIILPFTTEYSGTPAQMKAWRAAALVKAEDIIGTRFSPESYTLSQSYYYGDVRGSELETRRVDGLRIDVGIDFSTVLVKEPEEADDLPASAKPEITSQDIEELEYFLSLLPSSMERNEWIKIAWAIHAKFGDEGFPYFNAWSAGCEEKYRGEDHTRAVWSSLTRGKRDGPKVTYATLCKMAADAGADLRKFADPMHGLIIPECNRVDSDVVQALMQDMTEDTMALAARMSFTGRYIYLYGADSWFQWDGARWRQDALHDLEEALAAMVRGANRGREKSASKSSFISGVERTLRTMAQMKADYALFDADNYLLNTPGGTYDLRTGERRDHNPMDGITRCTRVAPSREGGGVFMRFLSEITEGDKELQLFHQRSLGACLSGAVEEHWLLFWYGDGRNGKNTLSDAVRELLGDYAEEVSSELLMTKRQSDDSGIMRVKGRRLVTAGEIAEGSHWNETLIKGMTGNAAITGRPLYGSWVTFPRTHKHLIHGNNQPLMVSADKAIRVRMKIVPFKASFDGPITDLNLPAKLRKEYPYILQWLLDGHKIWWDAGKRVGSCAAVDAESVEYYAALSTTEAWMEECCDIHTDLDQPASYWTQAGDLYACYKGWKEARGESAKGQTRLGMELGKRFSKVQSAGARYVGLKLKPSAAHYLRPI